MMRRTIREITSPWYLMGPSFVLAVFFWGHYQMGLAKLFENVSFPDFVCLFGCLFIIVLLVVTSVGRAHHLYAHRPILVFAGLAGGVASILCLALPALVGGGLELSAILGAFCYALFLMCYWLLWLDLYRRQTVMLAVVYLLFSTALGSCIAWLILGLDAVRTPWALAGMMVLSALFLLRGIRESSGHDVPKDALSKDALSKDTSPKDAEAPGATPAKRLPLGFALISFAFSAAYMYTIEVNGLETFHLVFTWDLPLSSLLLLVVGVLLRRQLTLARLFSLAAPLMIIGLLITLLVEVSTFFLFSLFHLGYFLYLVFILILYCGYAKAARTRTFALAGALILSVFAGCYAGRLLYATLALLFAEVAPANLVAVSIGIIGLLVVCTIYGIQSIYWLFSARAGQEPARFEVRFDELGTGGAPTLDAHEVAALYQLSEREKEVLLLLLERKSATQIAEEMVVAHGTVKAHTRNIYKKLGIHQREELFALVTAPYPPRK